MVLVLDGDDFVASDDTVGGMKVVQVGGGGGEFRDE